MRDVFLQEAAQLKCSRGFSQPFPRSGEVRDPVDGGGALGTRNAQERLDTGKGPGNVVCQLLPPPLKRCEHPEGLILLRAHFGWFPEDEVVDQDQASACTGEFAGNSRIPCDAGRVVDAGGIHRVGAIGRGSAGEFTGCRADAHMHVRSVHAESRIQIGDCASHEASSVGIGGIAGIIVDHEQRDDLRSLLDGMPQWRVVIHAECAAHPDDGARPGAGGVPAAHTLQSRNMTDSSAIVSISRHNAYRV